MGGGPDIDVVFAAMAVTDFAAAVSWYARLLGRPADIVVKDDEFMWRLAATAWLYVLADEVHAGHAILTLSVPSLEAALADLRGRGIDGGPIEIIGDAGRKASFTDPMATPSASSRWPRRADSPARCGAARLNRGGAGLA